MKRERKVDKSLKYKTLKIKKILSLLFMLLIIFGLVFTYKFYNQIFNTVLLYGVIIFALLFIYEISLCVNKKDNVNKNVNTKEEGKYKLLDIFTNQDVFLNAKIGNGKIQFVGNEKASNSIKENILLISNSFKSFYDDDLKKAITKKCEESKINNKENFELVENNISCGVKGKIDNVIYTIGSKEYLNDNNINTEDYDDLIENVVNEGKNYYMYISKLNRVFGVIRFEVK